VSVENVGRVRHLVLNRPEKRNAFNNDLVQALHAAAQEAAAASDVHCVVLRGNGPSFSAGIDLFQLAGLGDTNSLRSFRTAALGMANSFEEMTKPVIAQIHGPCIGLGAEVALACDLRVMSEEATFGLPETRLGLIPDVGGSTRLPAVVGLGNAKELIMTGRIIGGPECLRIGAANRVVPGPELDAATQSLVDELLAVSPIAVGLSKRVLDGVAKPTLAASLEQEVTIQQTLVATDDFREAGAAFMEKRPPNWTGRMPGPRAPEEAPEPVPENA
jgi:enoyl-CoA hydratase/carnithine racemase